MKSFVQNITLKGAISLIFGAVLAFLGLSIAMAGILFFYMENDLLLTVTLCVSGCVMYTSFKAMGPGLDALNV